jgi:hypothetical protein
LDLLSLLQTVCITNDTFKITYWIHSKDMTYLSMTLWAQSFVFLPPMLLNLAICVKRLCLKPWKLCSNLGLSRTNKKSILQALLVRVELTNCIALGSVKDAD